MNKIDEFVHIGYHKIQKQRINNPCGPVIIGSDVIIRAGSIVYSGCEIGDETMIGHHVIIREGTKIGKDCIIGHHVVFEGATEVGDHSAIHSQCHITSYTKIGSYVFMGPMTVTSNDPVMGHKRKNIEVAPNGPTILDGARIGCGCVILPGIVIGREAIVGAGSLVTKDIPDYSIAYGSPAKVMGKVPENALLKNNGIDI